jgi:hypothetical protein
LGTDERTSRDLLLLLPVETTNRVTNLRTKIDGEAGLEVTADAGSLDQAAPNLETRSYANDSGPAAADGHHVVTGWIWRIPVTLNPTMPWDIGGDRYPLTVTATYQVAGESQARTFRARAAVDAQVSSAIYEMGLAASILPLLCIIAAMVRWRRTR